MKTLVMTGGTSGFGQIAARHLSASPDTRLVRGARGNSPADIESLPLDLTSLNSVRTFAAAVAERIGEREIDALILNAGMLSANVEGRTADGFETTFAVNHLAHYLLLRLLLDKLSYGAIVIATTSGAHDPAENAGLPTPSHVDAALLAHPDRGESHEKPGTAARRAYTTSKLCNILMMRGIAALPDIRDRRITTIAYCPGQTPGTGLVRDMSLPLRLGWRLLGSPLRVLSPRLSTREASGGALADLALGLIAPPDGEYYATLRRGSIVWQQPSELARRDDLRDALWNDSAALAGLTSAQQQPAVHPAPPRTHTALSGHAVDFVAA